MSKINVTQELLDAKGEKINVFKEYVCLNEKQTELIKDTDGSPMIFIDSKGKGEALTLREVLYIALRARKEETKVEQSYQILKLSRKILNNEEVEFETADKTQIYEGLKKTGYNNEIVGAIYEILEEKGDESTKLSKKKKSE